VYNKNRNVVVASTVRDKGKEFNALYLLTDGQLTPVLLPGQDLPDGGKFKDLQLRLYTASFANDAGQHAILITLADNSTAAYLPEPDGKLSLILKSGTTINLGTITRVGGSHSGGVGLNNKGQVALPVTIGTGVDTIVLLTPAP
jgi:hypothetical protein